MQRYGRDGEGEKKSWLKSLVVFKAAKSRARETETETEREKRRLAEREREGGRSLRQ